MESRLAEEMSLLAEQEVNKQNEEQNKKQNVLNQKGVAYKFLFNRK